jgi:hypothetical protein
MEMIEARHAVRANDHSRMRVSVNVRLFGILALLTRQRLVEMTLARGATAGDVLGELGKRFGPDFLARLLRVPGELRSHCAFFANGEQVNDLNTEVACGCGPAEITVILFMASEGG